MDDSKMYDHLTNHQEDPDKSSLEKLVNLANTQLHLENQVEALDERLKEAKARLFAVQQAEIPNMMAALGLKSFKLQNGKEITIKSGYSTTVNDWNIFVKYLDETGDGAIVKTVANLGKVPEEIVQKITEYLMNNFEIAPTIKQDIHHKTLEKYIKEKLAEMSAEDLNAVLRKECGKVYGVEPKADFEVLKIFAYNKAKIK